MLKKLSGLVLEYLFFAIGIGAVISTICMLQVFGDSEALHQIAVWLVASGIMGVLTLIYEIDGLTHLTATCIHAPLIFLTALISGWVLGYGDGSVPLLLARMLPAILIIYIAVHLLMFFMRRLQVHSLNDRLKK